MIRATAPVAQLTDVSVRFPGVQALDGVSFRLFPGEVHSLMGENGAGKSTLIKALTGVQQIDSGSIELDGSPVSFASTAEAQAAGISTVYQEVNLLPNLTVAENVLLGREPRHRFGGIDWKAARARTSEVLTGLRLDVDPRSLLADHSPAVQQLIAIARATSVQAKVLVLDEPTSSLDNDEVTELFRVIRGLKESGVAILFVSHFLEQVYEISDRLTVLRDGRLVGEYLTDELLKIDLIQKMVGKELSALASIRHGDGGGGDGGLDGRDGLERAGGLDGSGGHEGADGLDGTGSLDGPGGPDAVDAAASGLGPHGDAHPLVEAIGLGRRGGIEPLDLRIHEGEIVGVAGLLGSGRTELARLLAGADRPDEGELLVDGERQRFRGPSGGLKRRIVYASENRRTEGILGDLTIRENIVLALQADLGWFRRIPIRRQTELAVSYMQALGIKPADPEARMSTLSGGNQQKVLLARWLAIAPRLLILDEPTRGIDIGAKAEIQKLVSDLAENGLAVLFISAELEEVIRISDRIAVLRERRKVGDLVNHDLTVDRVLAVIAAAPADEVPS